MTKGLKEREREITEKMMQGRKAIKQLNSIAEKREKKSTNSRIYKTIIESIGIYASEAQNPNTEKSE